jgi:putative hydrolase of the HAD superfamily
MIKAVLFDYGGVLSEGGGKYSLSDTIAKLYGFKVGWDKLADLHGDLIRGSITTEEFFKRLAAIHNSPKIVTEAEWDEASENVYELSRPVVDLAGRLRQRGIKTGILSNVYAMSAKHHRELGNYNGFDPVVLSCEIGAAKPDARIYMTAVERLGVLPTEVLFVDDQEKWLPSAQAFGMHTIHATNPQQIVDDITRAIKAENGIDL